MVSAKKQTELVQRLIAIGAEAIATLPIAEHPGALTRAGVAFRRTIARGWPALPSSELARLEATFIAVVAERTREIINTERKAHGKT